MAGSLLTRASIAISAFLACATHAHAQMIGLGALLNPEGSRLFPQSLMVPRHPGKPDLRWRSFDWEYADLTGGGAGYRLYFYKEAEWTARYAAPRISEQVTQLAGVFKFTPKTKFNYVLFSSQRDFQQANIFYITEGVEGITSATEATMALPYWGEAETFRHISTHEMVHQFQFQKINEMAPLPLWFIEGMAEYYSLNGVDPESRQYVRDLLAYPDPKRDYEAPKFFQETPYDFIHIYKMGQVRLDFLETEYGRGTVQMILDAAAPGKSGGPFGGPMEQGGWFEKTLARLTHDSAERIQERWKSYLDRNYRAEANRLSQAMTDFEEIKEAGDTLDLYDISPDGNLLATREIEPLSSTTFIRLCDLRDCARKTEAARNNTPSTLSLYFFQRPALALSDHLIAYVAETTSGPELEIREIERRWENHFHLERPWRVKLHEHGMIQASSLAISPDERRIALVGLSPRGSQNLYVVDLPGAGGFSAIPRQVTDGVYSWRNLAWADNGIIAASDQTANARYNLFLVSNLDTDTPKLTRLTNSLTDEYEPDGTKESLYFVSWASGSSQIHRLEDGVEARLTEAKTSLSQPRARPSGLYALGLKGGRFHLFRIPRRLGAPPPLNPNPDLAAWRLELADIPPSQIHPYRPFSSSGARLDNIWGFYGTGGVGGAVVAASDFMRNYGLAAEFLVLGQAQYTDAAVTFSSFLGRTKWVSGAYQTVESRLDNVFPDSVTRTYINREFGGLFALEYPVTAFSFVDAELRLAGVKRGSFSDPDLAPKWEALNPGLQFLVTPTLRFGYDRILYELFTGPLKGYGLLLEADTSLYPGHDQLSERGRLDAAWYWELFGRTVLGARAMAGASVGGPFREPFYISSDDIMRAYLFGDTRLLGNYAAAAKAELRFPIGTFFGFPPLRGLGAIDYGTIFRQWGQEGSGIASSASGGITLNIPPISINLILSFPIHLATGPSDGSVFHFTLRYLYL